MKVLCLGNNTERTNDQALAFSIENKLEFRGLISDIDCKYDFDTLSNGCYHSSVLDLSIVRISKILELFDKIIILDQSISEWQHPNEFYNTINVVKNHCNVVYQGTQVDNIVYWETLVKTNKSFCIFPFVEYITHNNNTVVCCRSSVPVANVDCNFKTDAGYNSIRSKMIAGERITNCSKCYEAEDNNIVSARILETVEWANRLHLTDISSLSKLTTPSYYEIRPSNKCNLQCRMCSPISSHLIHDEYVELGLATEQTFEYMDFDIVDFSNLRKLYVSGGEPLINKSFFAFLRKCIENEQTDFELLVNTNATTLSSAFKQLIAQFSDFQFIFSIDAYKDINYYIRWPTIWDTTIANIDYLVSMKHHVTFNVTVSIYNVSSLNDILQYLELRYSELHVHIQFAGSTDGILSPFNYPNKDTVIDQLRCITKLNLYKVSQETQDIINSLLLHYQSNKEYDKHKLGKFFEFNTKLDKSRNVYLGDYIPELNLYNNV